ncbi:tRNA-dihydrouridine synthase 2 [Kwoniella heveanensis BCC8398]|uniref:tRNA-dihydrouridine synthase 2 n=1 Tax=Kwoniella heveanensis BCC8398 TaxID=1296120 RepID=A0A1B9GL49_9TREE|nr:tRNA-dihydrouridine synthase 2 [Kwoniella heveanensis BCC8398]
MPIATARSASPSFSANGSGDRADGPRDAKRLKMESNFGTGTVKLVAQGQEQKLELEQASAEEVKPVASSSSSQLVPATAEVPAETQDTPKQDIRSEEELVEEQMSLPIEYPKSYENELDYKEKLVLAPMVRTGSLPMRLLSLYYGAGLVWSPEVVDKAIIGSERVVDPKTGVITYHKGQGPIFSCHPIEKPYLIFQIGSSNPELAVKAAQTVQQDVSGIDLNCGCPKPFSTHSGMGAALLSTPDILLNILRALLEHIPLPISAKIRLLPTQPSTLHLVSRIIRTGIRNLTVHCRTRDMRPGERALWERLGDLVKLGKRRGLPVICNGDGDGWTNWEQIKTETGADSVMIARAAERNPSVFQPTGPSCNLTEVVPKLLALAQYTNNPWGNTKFLLNQFKPSPPPISDMSKSERKHALEVISKSKSVEHAAEGLKISLPADNGRAVFDMIAKKIRERQGSDGTDEPTIWEERHEAEIHGKVVDEPVHSIEEDDEEAMMNGFEVGVGQAQAQKTPTQAQSATL